MEPIVWLAILIALAVVAIAIAVGIRQRKRAALRDRFGPEYDRAVERSGNRREAEHELAEIAHKRDTLDIRDVDPESARQWTEEWEAIQARFVDSPASAVGSASTLLTHVMEERGYPVRDFDERASLVAADHPDVVEHYREAQHAFDRYQQEGAGDTEDLRQSFVHYRELFEALVPAGAVPGGSSNGYDPRDAGTARHDGTAHRNPEVQR